MTAEIKLEDLKLSGEIVNLKDYSIEKKNGTGPRYQTDLKRCAIIGFAPSSLGQAIGSVFKNDEWTAEKGCETWGLNELYQVDPSIDAKCTRWFDIHDPRSTISTRDDKNMDWLAKQTRPIYMVQHYADIPASAPYPLQEIVKYWDSDYLTNTISMMILLAAMEGRSFKDEPLLLDEFDTEAEAQRLCITLSKTGQFCVPNEVDGKWQVNSILRRGVITDRSKAFGEIQVWGVDMAQDSEYNHQRPSCEAAIGFARGLGIKVFIPDTSDLMKCLFVYGYTADGMHVRAKLDARIGELKAQADNHRNIGQNARMQCAAMIGAANEMAAICNKAERSGIQHPVLDEMKARIQEMQPEIQKLNGAADGNLNRAAMLDGAHDDAVYWRRAWSGA